MILRVILESVTNRIILEKDERLDVTWCQVRPVRRVLETHVTRHNTPIQNILSTAPQLSISQKALGTLPEDGNVMPKHVGATIHN
jgi:hypothetical protein